MTGAVVLLVVAPTVWRIWSHASAPLPVRLIFVLFLALLFGIAPLSWAGKAFGWIRSRVLVRISSSGLVVERQSAWSSKTERIAAADILDVDFSTVQGTIQSVPHSTGRLAKALSNPGVIVKSRTGLVPFGQGLRAEELRFLACVLKKSLAAS